MLTAAVFTPMGNGIIRHERHITYARASSGSRSVITLKIFKPGMISVFMAKVANSADMQWGGGGRKRNKGLSLHYITNLKQTL